MYDLMRLGQNTYMIQAPTNIGIYQWNENKVCLIDSGINDHMAERILNVLRNKGWKLDVIFNTHHHSDHGGGNAYLQEMTGCKVYSSEVNALFLRKPYLNTSLVYGGDAPEELQNKMLISRPCECAIADDSMLPKGFEMKRMDGHSAEMMIYKTPDQVWFLGDCVLGKKILEHCPLSYILQIETYLKSLEEVERLKGSLFVPAHGEATVKVKDLADANRTAVWQVTERILSFCQSSITTEQLAKAVFDSYDMKLDFTQYALNLAALRSYLTYLEKNHRMIAEMKENQWMWRSVDCNPRDKNQNL